MELHGRRWLPILLLLAGCRAGLPAAAPAVPVPPRPPVTAAVSPGLRHAAAGRDSLRRGRAAAAVGDFHRCLVIAPGNRDCLDGKGRAHAALRQWEDAVTAWSELAAAVPEDKDLAARLAAAERAWDSHKRRRAKAARHFPIGGVSLPEDAPLRLKLVARFQRYSTSTLHASDIYDTDIDSPKSVAISTDGTEAYVNSLEGGRTVIYDTAGPAKRGVIRHNFGPAQAGLFPAGEPWFGARFGGDLPPAGPNVFTGKPVESAFSHGGRYLWVPYYRRSFDLDGTQPSAVSVIDTATKRVVRVLPAGPIAKNVAASPDGRFLAVAHWGADSVGFIDISSSSPEGFGEAGLAVIGSSAAPDGSAGMDRDRECGLCVRGLAWSRDSRSLYAGCMGGAGGVAVISVPADGAPRLVGRAALGGNPRDLAVSADDKWLYIASSLAGALLRVRADSLEKAAAAGKKLSGEAVTLGGMPRSMRLSPDGRWAFAALHSDSQVVAVDLEKMAVTARIGADSFPVGLDISPDGRYLWVTSQGVDGAGGNSVEVFEVTSPRARPLHPVPPLP